MTNSDGLTEFGEFCEKYDIPVFDRSSIYEFWVTGRARIEREYDSWRGAEASGFRRRGASRKNQF